MTNESKRTLIDYLLEPGFEHRPIESYHRVHDEYSIHASVNRVTRWIPEFDGSLTTHFEASWRIYDMEASGFDKPIEEGDMPDGLTAKQVVQWWSETVEALDGWDGSETL